MYKGYPAIDRIENFRPGEDGFVGLSSLPVLAEENLLERIDNAIEQSVPLKFGLISCMPKLGLISEGPKDLTYYYEGSGMKTAVDFNAVALSNWKDAFAERFGVSMELECLVADTEARVKSDGLLFPKRRDLIAQTTDKVIKRVRKSFPGTVRARSDVFPVASGIYRKYFRQTFLQLLREIDEEGALYRPRLLARENDLSALALDLDFVKYRAKRDLALQDAEYAMEGLWIARESDWDGYLIIDNYPLSAANSTTRLLETGELPILFPVNYD